MIGSRLFARLALATALATTLAGVAGCANAPIARVDAMTAIPRETPGESRLAYRWKFQTADHRTEIGPQEFASPAVSPDRVFVGSQNGMFFALSARDGHVVWKKQIGAVLCAPFVSGGQLYIGTADGSMISIDAETARENWRYQSRGSIEQTAILASGNTLLFANEADQVVALDASSGKFKWQYKAETPDEFTLRGHAGVAADGDLLYTGFSNGTLVALRRENGSIAWSTSLKGDATKFVDVDATPIVIGNTVFASSSSGGLFALDKLTGQIRWRTPFYDISQPSSTGNVGGMISDGKLIYVSVADLGTYAMDLSGNIVWRVGAKDGGEPASPLLYGDLLVYTLASDGMFLAKRKSGETVEWWDPGDGVSAEPAFNSDGQMFVMSNRGVLYAFDVD